MCLSDAVNQRLLMCVVLQVAVCCVFALVVRTWLPLGTTKLSADLSNHEKQRFGLDVVDMPDKN